MYLFLTKLNFQINLQFPHVEEAHLRILNFQFWYLLKYNFVTL